MFRSERGSAVLAGLVNITLATLITLSVLAIAMAGYYTLVIRDLAIDSATRLATYGSVSQREYLLQRLQVSLPELASFDVQESRGDSLTLIRVSYSLPGFGMFQPSATHLDVQAATEKL